MLPVRLPAAIRRTARPDRLANAQRKRLAPEPLVRYEAAMHSRVVIAASLLLAACSSLPSTSQPGDGSRLHVVLFWLKPEMPAAEREAIPVEMAAKAALVPGLDAVWTGRPAGTPRDVVDNSFDLMLVMRFRDAAAAKAWDDDPIHLQLVARFKPWFARVVVYDGK